jgi:hypothetical protein
VREALLVDQGAQAAAGETANGIQGDRRHTQSVQHARDVDAAAARIQSRRTAAELGTAYHFVHQDRDVQGRIDRERDYREHEASRISLRAAAGERWIGAGCCTWQDICSLCHAFS